MQQISRMIFLGLLTGLTILDLKDRRLSPEMLAAGGFLAAGYCAVFCREEGLLHLFGFLAGALFLALSRVTEEGIAYGDSWLMCVLGLYLGLWKFLGLLLTAWSMASVMAMLTLVRCGYKRHKTLPMVPMLLLGYLTVWAAELWS